MYKHLYLLTLLLLVTLFSCKKTEVPQSRKQLIGKWQIKMIVTKHLVDKVVTSQETKTNFGPADYLQFNEDDTGYVSLKQPNSNQPYGNINFVANQLNENDVNGTFSNGNFNFYINSISQSTLQFNYGYTTGGYNVADKDKYVDTFDVTATRL